MHMFVRKKRHRSGSTSIIVVDKSNNRFREVKVIGASSDPDELCRLCQQAKEWMSSYGGQQQLDFSCESALKEQELKEVERVVGNIENILINGSELLLEKVYHSIGFSAIKDEVLRHLVIARVCQPSSKSGTVEYLKSYFDKDLSLDQIYRYLDKLYSTLQDKVQCISIDHTRSILGGRIGLVFYDVTTLYFETDKSDTLRATGFSKEGRHSNPQVVLGLLVSAGGYPLSYSLFNGSQYEGRTMIPVVEDFVRRFDLDDFVVVADSGLMNKMNLELLRSAGYKYVIGARIKNENEEIKSWILSLEKEEGCFYERNKDHGERLIIGYSSGRARKDAYNRNKGISRLEKSYAGGMITKNSINKRGYNKFLDIGKDVKVSINQAKIAEDSYWDGLKGYLTNTTLSAEQVYEQYQGLWVVERAFRVTKGTLDIRPMFHFTEKRIEAHVCICFIAYKVYKELERVIKKAEINMSVDKVLATAKTITTLKIRLPRNEDVYYKTMLLTPRHKAIKKLFEDDFEFG